MNRPIWLSDRLKWPLRGAVGLMVVALLALYSADLLTPRTTLQDLERRQPALAGLFDPDSAEVRAESGGAASGQVLLERLVRRWRAAAGSFELWDTAPEYASQAALDDWNAGRRISFTGLDHPAWSVPEDPSWTEDPYDDPEWRKWYHSLAWLKAPAHGYVTTGRKEYAQQVERYLFDWIASNPRSDVLADEAWFPEAVEIRTTTLIHLYDHVLASRLAAGKVIDLLISLREHGRELAQRLHGDRSTDEDGQVARALTLYQLAVRFPAVSDASQWRHSARSQLIQVMAGHADAAGLEPHQRPMEEIVALFDTVSYQLAEFGEPLTADEMDHRYRLGALPLDNAGFDSPLTSAIDDDDATIHGWPHCAGQTRVTSEAWRSGPCSLRMEGGGELRPCASHEVPVTGGELYRLSAWLRGAAANGLSAGGILQIRWLDEAMQFISNEGSGLVVGRYVSWTRHVQSFRAPLHARHARVDLYVTASTQPGSFVYYDDVQLYRVPDAQR